MLGDGVGEIAIERRMFTFRFRSPDHWLSLFRAYFGPMKRAFEALDADEQDAFATDLLEACGRFNRADDGTLVCPADYLEVVAIRR